jgi:hypothetical protein
MSQDSATIEAIVRCVTSGATSRAAIVMQLGLSPDRANRLIGTAIRQGRLRATGRDKFKSPTFAVSSSPQEAMSC